ncbi:MAG TPA: ATP-dependent zinc metalloprotease FtsH [bacterium]|nr:ATP-dependent zinc metalloprotease FtsH [bacterium]
MAAKKKYKFPFPRFSFLAYFLFIFFAYWVLQSLLPAPRVVSYNEFLELIDSGRVKSVQWGDAQLVAEAKPAPGAKDPNQVEIILTNQLAAVDQTALVKKLVDSRIPVTGKSDRPSWLQQFVVNWVVPIGIFLFFYAWLSNRMSRSAAGPFGFGKSKAKLYDQLQKEKVTFEDVAALEEPKAELKEVVDFLKNPRKYLALGARIPRGVLLVGLPGTGKTLLARAVAGEAGVPFFSLSGSEFIEMFVGVGAARIRDLFEQAKTQAPCIVFIDELDAIGKTRGVGFTGAHDEREQTLNQLLAELDGFDTSGGVILMAATNRPEVLDQALLRPGRFDRQVVLDPPDLAGRQAILKVHCRKVKLEDQANLEVVAKRTPGMVGADLANVVNEAALAAARRGGDKVGMADLEEAIDRLQLGLKKKSTVMREEEKRRVAYHEAGHALTALTVPKADPVHRVTIIPRSIGALGATLQLPTEERHLVTKEEILDRLCVMFGGRAAEELVFSDISTGAKDDLERATETARQMVCRFGMGGKLGPATFGRTQELQYLNLPFGTGEERNFSEQTARLIDTEVRSIIGKEYGRALGLLRRRRRTLEAIALELLAHETLEKADLERILAEKGSGTAPGRRARKPVPAQKAERTGNLEGGSRRENPGTSVQEKGGTL